MEAKLKLEIEALPTPQTTFDELEANVKPPKRFRLHRRTSVLIAAVLALLLCGAGYAKTRYGMWLIYSSKGWSDVQSAAEKFELKLPETLDGVPFDSYRTYGHVPQKAPLLQAYLNPAYRPYCVDYAIWETTEVTMPDGTPTMYTHTIEDFRLNFGTTENGLWRYYFTFDENDIWTACDNPESYVVIEYKGIQLQIGDTVFYNDLEDRDIYTRWVHWIDEEKRVVFALNENDYEDPERVIECAKLIIDMNQ